MELTVDDRAAVTGGRAESVSRHPHAEASQDGPPDQRAEQWNQQEKTDRVGEEAGGQQERTGRHQADPVKGLFDRQFASREGLLGAGQRAQPLSANEGAARHRGQDHQRNSGPNADLAADNDKQRDFSGRDTDKQQE